MLGPVKEGPIAAATGGAREVGSAVDESLHQITRVFGPSGIGRVFTLLFTDAKRGTRIRRASSGSDRRSVRPVSAGDWGAVCISCRFITEFIGLLNLIPLPPFDGGHLAVLAIEKIRGKKIDIRKVIPVSVVVMGFFIVFVLSTMLLDITKPISFRPRTRNWPAGSPQVLHTAPGDRHTSRIRWAHE